MYPPLAPDAVHLEGGYIPYKLRQKDLFTQFVRSRDRIFYQKGIRRLRCHIACSETKIPMLKFCVKDGWILDHWISEVIIGLPFFRSDVFVHHPIKETDFDKFPVTLFHHDPRP
jgi:hypothetical protein